MIHAPHPIRRALMLLGPTLVVAAVLAGCSTCFPGNIAESPKQWYKSMLDALRTDNSNDFRYLLSRKMREEWSQGIIDAGWDQAKQAIAVDPETARFVEVEYIRAPAEFAPAPAARVRVAYEPPEGGEVHEDFLLLLQYDSFYTDDGTYAGERWPVWRVQPYEPYQRGRVWFSTEVPPAEPAPSDPATTEQP